MSKPNVIFIVSDQHRGDFMGCAGNKVVHTPNLDQLAQGGVRFAETYCNSPFCVPSRTSMLTGRYPHQTGVFVNSDHLASDIPTFVHGLALGGYETVLCGRMHFVGPDQRHGYQKRLVGDITPSYLGGPSSEYGHLKGTAAQGLRSIEMAGPGQSPVMDYDEAVTHGFEQFISERNDGEEQPLFATIGLYGPHPPFVCPEELYDQAIAAMAEHDSTISLDEQPRHPWLENWFNRLKADQITPEQLTRARANYIGLVNRLDQLVGRIVEASKSLQGETWIVYVSDHGEMAGDRGMFWKRSFYEGSVRVPMIWHPLQQNDNANGIIKGSTVDVPVSLIDLAPTLLNLTESPVPSFLSGNDLSPLLFGRGTGGSVWENDLPVYSELISEQDSAIRMVRLGHYKLIYYHNYPPFQLFDLSKDPHEKINLAQNEEYRDIVEKLSEFVFQGWDPDSLVDSAWKRNEDQKFLTRWGKEVGFERHEVWNPEKTC
jgi:choline-sulfatase